MKSEEMKRRKLWKKISKVCSRWVVGGTSFVLVGGEKIGNHRN